MVSGRKNINYIRNDLLFKTTQAENAAFSNLKRLGYNAILQKPIYTGRRLYFADLYISELRLIIEIDGAYHYTSTQKRKDRNRSSGIRRLGYHIVRLNNHDARDIKKLKAKINMILRRK